MAKQKSNRGAVIGLIFLGIVWTSVAIWFFLPFKNRPTKFPDDYFSMTAPRAVVEPGPEVPVNGEIRTGTGTMAAVDAFVTQSGGYAVEQSDFGISTRLYGRRDFRAAQEKAESLYALRNQGRGSWYYGAFISALARLGTEENVDSMLNTLRNWQQNYPEAQFSLMVEAVLRMNLADAIRAGKWSSSVGRAATLGDETNVRQAKTLLEQAMKLAPEDAQPAVYLMRASAALREPASKIDEYFEYAYERSPQNYATWSRKLRLLAPNWGGSWREMDEFMKRAQEEAKKYPQVELVVVDGLVEMHSRGVAGIDLTSPDQWQQVVDIFNRVLAAYPGDLHVMSLYAHRAAQFCLDRGQVAQLFDDIGDRYVDGSIWGSLAEYNLARTHAYVEYARANKGPEANARIAKAYEMSPDDWYVAYHYGLSKASGGELPKALEALLRAVDTNPSYLPALNAVAHVYLHLDDHTNAAVYANRALVREPLGSLLYEAEALLADAEARQHADATGPVIPHEH